MGKNCYDCGESLHPGYGQVFDENKINYCHGCFARLNKIDTDKKFMASRIHLEDEPGIPLKTRDELVKFDSMSANFQPIIMPTLNNIELKDSNNDRQ